MILKERLTLAVLFCRVVWVAAILIWVTELLQLQVPHP